MDIDYSQMIETLSWGTLVAAIVAFGVVELAPNFTMWAVDRVAGFFGRDPYGRDDPDNYSND